MLELRLAHGNVSAIAFSPDGGLLATCGTAIDHNQGGVRRLEASPDSGLLKLWDAKTGELKRDLKGEHCNRVLDVAFSPDGRFLASAGHWRNNSTAGAGVKIWDPHAGKVTKVLTIPRGHLGGRPTCFGFSPDGKRMAMGVMQYDRNSVGTSGSINVVCPSSGILELSWPVPWSVRPVAFSQDGQTIAAMSDKNVVTLWESTTGVPIHELRPTENPDGERWDYFAFSPTDNALAIGGIDAEKRNFVEVWRTRVAKTQPAKTQPIGAKAANRPGERSEQATPTDDQSSDRQSLAYAVKRFNESTAEVRSELFDPPIEDLTVERLREGFRQSAQLYRDRGKRQIADALLKIAESGRLPDEAVGGLIGSGTHAQDEDGKTISRQVVPALVLPDNSTPSGRLLVALRPLELFYRKDGPVSKDYGDLFDLERGHLIEGAELAADFRNILGHWEVVSVEGSGGRFMSLSDQSKPGDRLVIAHVESPNGRLWLSEALRDTWSRDDSLHLHPKADPSRLR